MMQQLVARQPADPSAEALVEVLDRDGIVLLPTLVGMDRLSAMQQAFAARLTGLRWNDLDGFVMTEPYRHMVEDVLTVEQGFVDLALHPLVKDILRRYLGARFALVEAKGWRSVPTSRDFHGWHGDAWYDTALRTDIPREVKLGFYLTDVRSGAFKYVKRSHRKQSPRAVDAAELAHIPSAQILEVLGPAGSCFLFDTSGIHRQSVPILEARQAVFFNYHDPSVSLQQEDLAYYRYHPLILNAAFLGHLEQGDPEILGFGDKTNYVPTYQRPSGQPLVRGVGRLALETTLWIGTWWSRVSGRVKRMI
jgi:hypothetical protein